MVSRYQRVQATVRPPVRAWILGPPAGPTARNAKSRSGLWPLCQPAATVIVRTGQAPYGDWPLWYSGTYSMLLAKPFWSTQCAAVMMRSPAVDFTVAAVQKCVLDPVVPNSAPVVGTPLK